MLGDVCPLKAPASSQVRWVVLLQDDLHDGLGTRVAAPLLRAEEVPRPVRGSTRASVSRTPIGAS